MTVILSFLFPVEKLIHVRQTLNEAFLRWSLPSSTAHSQLVTPGEWIPMILLRSYEGIREHSKACLRETTRS